MIVRHVGLALALGATYVYVGAVVCHDALIVSFKVVLNGSGCPVSIVGM
jgi:hypothetical protein